MLLIVLSGGAIVGIALGGVLLLAVFITVSIYFWCKDDTNIVKPSPTTRVSAQPNTTASAQTATPAAQAPAHVTNFNQAYPPGYIPAAPATSAPRYPTHMDLHLGLHQDYIPKGWLQACTQCLEATTRALYTLDLQLGHLVNLQLTVIQECKLHFGAPPSPQSKL